MKPTGLAGALIVAVATVMLLAPSLGVGTSGASTTARAPSTATVTAFGLGVDLPAEMPLPTETPQPTWTPQPPQVIYIQVPPQTIYVQVPAAAPAESQAPVQLAMAPPAAPSCHPAYVGVCLDANAADYDCLGTIGDGPQFTPGPFRVVGIDAFLLDPDGNGIGCDLPSPATPQPTAVPDATSTPVGPTNTPVFTSTPRPTRTPQPTATPVMVRGQVIVNFAGTSLQRPTATMAFTVSPGAKGWDAVRQAVGVSNLAYQDFGGSLGIFITGFYGAVAQGNHFWELFINGQSSMVGVSGYTVGDGDILEFRYSSF